MALRSWRIEFESSAPIDKKNNLDPPGFDAAQARDPMSSQTSATKRDSAALARKQQALFAKATSPIKNCLMLCFVMWMVGNSIQIFSIIMTLNGLATPISAILKSGEVFPREDDVNVDVFTPRILYCIIYFAQFLYGLYKLNSMGLLPAHASDWVSTIAVPNALEFSYAAAS